MLILASARASAADLSLRLRVAWGGGNEQQWSGKIALSEGNLSDPVPLGVEADEPGSMWVAGGAIEIRARSLRAYDGVDVSVQAPADARLLVQLSTNVMGQQPPTLEIPLAELISAFHDSELEGGNRLLIRRSPGDSLRVTLPAAQHSLIYSPAATLSLKLQPHKLAAAPGTKVRFELKLTRSGLDQAHWSEDRELTLKDDESDSLPIECKLPEDEGVYELAIQAKTRNRFGISQLLAERKVQLLVLATSTLAAPLDAERSMTKLAEIDPVEPLNSNWWNRFTTMSLIPGLRKGPLSSEDVQSWEHPQLKQTMIRLGPGGREPAIGWLAYPLPIERIGEPHAVEVEYPSDQSQTLGISIVEPNAAGSLLPIGLDSGVYNDSPANTADPQIERHRVLFWPRTRSPLLLLTNRRDGTRAVVSKIRLMGGSPRLPRAFPRDLPTQRLFAAYLDRPLFPENFGAAEALDAFSGRCLDDWRTFHDGGTRLVEYLNHVGYNGLMISVLADGSSIYPSTLLQPTPRYDTGAFFGSGQDPLRKDVLEMLFRQFNREQLRLIPAIEFASPLPKLEALTRANRPEESGIEWIGANGLPWRQQFRPQRGLAPHYNLLHPAVQEAMLEVVRDLVSRYQHHPAFAGLGLQLTADGFAHLPGVEWGFDDATIASFERDHPGLRVPGAGPERFALRAQYLLGDGRTKWVAWRAKRVTDFYHRVQLEVEKLGSGAKLYLTGANLLVGREAQQSLRPALPRQVRVDRFLLELGLEADLDRQLRSTVFLRPQRFTPVSSLSAQSVDLEINQAGEWRELTAKMATPGNLFYHPPQQARLESFDAKSPFKRSYTWLISEMLPSATGNRQRFSEALAGGDTQAIFDGGTLIPLGQEAALRDFVALYRRLPAARFQEVPGQHQPVTVRTYCDGGRTWVYLVNEAPWPVKLALSMSVSPRCAIEGLNAARLKPELVAAGQGSQWSLTLEPRGVHGAVFEAADLQVTRVAVELPEHSVANLYSRLEEFIERSASLRQPRPIPSLPLNASFEEPATGNTIPGWSDAQQLGTTVQIDDRQQHAGQKSLRLTSDGNKTWLRSEPFAPPRTGRFAMLVWLRVADTARQPPLRMVIEGQLHGGPYYRHAPLGVAPSGQRATPLNTEWDSYLFSIPDLPVEGLTQMRVGFDLMGAGDVWIDDVQLFDLVFEEQELLDFTRMYFLAQQDLQKQRVGDCLKFFEGYWPRFMFEHVPAPSPVRTAAQPKRTAPSPSAAEPRKPGFMDRLRGIMPQKSWF